MKPLIALLIALLLMTGVCFAEEPTLDTQINYMDCTGGKHSCPFAIDTIQMAGEVPVISFYDNDNNQVGAMYYQNGKLHFDGSSSASAKVFIQYLENKINLECKGNK